MTEARSITGYGLEYEHPVSKAIALRFAGMYPLPGMGEYRTVAISAAKCHLQLQNISGQFVLASTNWEKAHWPAIFGVDTLKLQRNSK